MRIPAEIAIEVKQLLKETGETQVDLQSFSPSSGGCINQGGKLKTSKGDYFLKWNQRQKFPGMFTKEARGLAILGQTNTLRVPLVVGVGETTQFQFLLLSYIDQQPRSGVYWKNLGEGIARLHSNYASRYGLGHDNFIGSLEQSNKQHDLWITFFIKERLEKQLVLMEKNGFAESRLRHKMESLYQKLPDILMEGKPSLVHGDLWSGNIMADEYGEPCIIDPAVYYGSGEVDLAMSKLFGAFNSRFYDAYQHVTKLESGFEERFELYNLYPLMVHVNLFGISYMSQVNAIIKKFT